LAAFGFKLWTSLKFALKGKSMRHLLTLGLAFGAIFLYGLGAEHASNTLIIIGACFELISYKRMRKP